MPKFHVDYRFIADAEEISEAGRKVEDFLPEAIEGIWYTIDKIELAKDENNTAQRYDLEAS